jgi:signal transduction histidine kinase
MPEMMASIMESGKRAARIVENMLSFSRKSEATTTLNATFPN